MGARYVNKAVTQAAAYLAANLPGKLRAVETELGLDADSLTDPVEVVSNRVPFDNRSPLLEVFEEGWTWTDQANRMLSVDLTIALSYVSDSDLGAGEQFMRRYITALIDTIHADQTLGGTVTAAILTDGSSAVARGDSSASRFVYTQGLEVRVNDA